ncbi:MAG: sigma-70 family RNA polymerase sigma factor [Candidatus Omnitrophica bacterium]|nr:sigma-70 family RNA polymerase sigma factor [Candidatus Omnitrophota bacterium]
MIQRENNGHQQFDIEEIFRQYNHKIYRLAISLSRNEKDAQDILQNTFIKIIKNLKYFRSQSNISTWIYRIAYNESLMFLRKKYSQSRAYSRVSLNQKKELPGMFFNWPKLPDEQLLEKELKDRLDSSISNLPIKYRMPLLLHNMEDLPIKEAAKVLGIKTNSFKTRLHRSRRLIGKEVSAYFQDKYRLNEKNDPRCAIWLDFFYNKAKQGAFQKHIRGCASCRKFIKTYNKAITITKGLECKDIPPELQEKIKSFLLKYKSA